MTTSSSWELHFREVRPPQEVRFNLERAIKTLFTSKIENDKLCMRAEATLVGAQYDFLLCFEAAGQAFNFYSLRMNVSWAEQSASHSEYYRKNAASWFELWTRDFLTASPALPGEGFSQRYELLCEEALNAEQQLDSIDAIQLAIVTALKGGATFRTSHKEGGTNIYWKNDRYVRSDYGEYPDERQFTDEMEFLNMLRQFYHWDVTSNSGDRQITELDLWRMILRRMNPN